MSPEEIEHLLEYLVLPTFEAFSQLEAEKKILAGGLPVGERAFIFIVEAASNSEIDILLRRLPAWGILEWTVTPLQSFEERAAEDRAFLDRLKKTET